MSILSPPPQIFMKISFKDLELLDSPQLSKKDVLCAVFLNENLIDKLSLDQHSSANLFFTSPDAKIRLIFRTKQTASVLGSISFLAQNLFSFNGKSFSQWLTLFDSSDDDEFDGNIGQDDEEKPRALIHYKINNSPIADSTVNLTSMEDVNITTDVKDMSIASSLPSLFYNITSVTDRESEADKAKIQKFEEINCYPNLEAISQVPVAESAYSSIAVQEIIQPAEETTFTIEEEKPRDLKQIREESEVLNTENSVVKTDTTEIIENKVYEVLNAMKNKGIFSNLDQSREFDANKYLLQQEFERNVKLQEALKGTEEKLLQSEKAYMELDMRTRTHIQGILDKNSVLGEENQALRDQIEMSYKKIIEGKSQELKDLSEQNKRNSQLFEEYKMKQERVAEELKGEIEHFKALYNQEKEVSQLLQKDLITIKNKAQQDLDSAKQVIKEYIGQVNKASEDLNENIKTNGDKMMEIEKLKTVKKSLEGELVLKEGVIEGMKREIEGYQRVIQELREAVSRFGSENEIEVAGLKRRIQELEESLRRENSMNQETLLQKQELENELIGFRTKNYEDVILRLQGELERSEKANWEMKELVSKMQEATHLKTGEMMTFEEEKERLRDQINILTKEQEDKVKSMQNLARENVGIRRRLEELEITNSQYEQNMEKFRHISEENQELRENLGNLREKLNQTMADLVKQTSLVLSQKATIKEQNEKIRTLESNLQDAFEDIQKFHLRLEAKNTKEAKEAKEAMERKLKEEARESRKALEAKLAQEAKEAREAMEAELEEMYLEVKKTIEVQVAAAKEKEVLPKATKEKGVVDIDHRLKELMNRSRIPMKFIRIGEGLYVFGSKRVHVKGINGKLAIRIGGGYMYIEEFIRLYAHQELAKLKTMKGDISYSNIEDEDLPDDVETSQIVSDTSLDEHYALRELEKIKGNDIRRIPETHTETPKKRTKSRMSHRSPTPENLYASSVTFRLGETRSGNKHRDSQELASYDSIWKETTRASSPNTSALNRTSKTPKKRMNGSMEFLSLGSLKRVSDEGYRTTPVRNSEGKGGILAKRRNYGRA